MTIYRNDVAEKVLHVLQSTSRLDEAKLRDAGEAADGNSAVMLENLIRNDGADEDFNHTILSRAYALRRAKIEPKQVDIRALQLIPNDIIDKYHALPFAIENRFLRIAIVDPNAASLASQLKATSGFNIEFQLITLRNFEMLRAHERIRVILDKREKKPQQSLNGNRPRRSRFAVDNDELVPEFCDHILHSAIKDGASDIHIDGFAILPE